MAETPAVYRVIADVAAEIAKTGIAKDRKNSQQNYNFRGVDDVYNALGPVLAAKGLVILPRFTARVCEERTSKSGSVLFYTFVDAEFDFVAALDGSKHTIRTFGEAMDSADKSTNKAMSAAYKYACFQAFSIPTEGDNDADAHTPEVAPKQQHAPRSATNGHAPASGNGNTITKDQGDALFELAKTNGINVRAIMDHLGVKRMGEITIPQYKDALKWTTNKDQRFAWPDRKQQAPAKPAPPQDDGEYCPQEDEIPL